MRRAHFAAAALIITAFATPLTAQADECRVLNVPRLDAKPEAERSWIGDLHGHHRERSAIAWMGRFGANDNYAEVRAIYDDEGIDLHVHVADLYIWWLLSDGVQWGGDPIADVEAWDGLEIAIDPEPTGGAPSDKAMRVVVANYPYNDPVQFPESSEPHVATRTYAWSGGSWGAVDDPMGTARPWYHTVGSSWNADPGPSDNTTEFDNGTMYTVFIPWSSLGVSEPPSGDVLRMMVRLHDIDDPRDADVSGGTPPSQKGLDEVGPLPVTAWPAAANDADTSTWTALVMHQKPYEAPAVTGEETIELTSATPGYRDATVGGHAFILDRWVEGGGDPEAFAWETCMDTNLTVRPDLFVHPEGTPTHLCFFSRAMLHWDLAGQIPAGHAITGATVRMFHFGGDTNEDEGTPGFDVATSSVQVHRIEGDWTDGPGAAGVTWNTAPYAAENVGFGKITPNVPDGENGKVVTFDVTPMVARAVARGEPLSLALYGADMGANTGKYLVSTEGGWQASDKPTLTIAHGPAVDPATLPPGDSCTLGVSADLFDPPGTGSPDEPIGQTPTDPPGQGGAGGGGGGPPGDGEGAAAGAEEGGASDDGGCGCRVATTSRSSTAVLLSILGFIGLGLRRRGFVGRRRPAA